MLKNLNNLIKTIVLEQVTEDKDEKYIKFVYHCNEFYNRYLVDLAEKNNVAVSKQRNNVFLAIGSFDNIIKYFSTLKVDELFMEDPSKFTIISPIYCFNDDQYAHNMQRGELFPSTTYDNAVTTHDVDNKVRSIVYGKWMDFYQNEKRGQKLLTIEPSKFKKYIKEVQKKFELNDDDIIYIEFSVNCEDWKNNIFEDMVEYYTEDEINERMVDDNRNLDDRFNYSDYIKSKDMNVESGNTDALKSVKRTRKTYKENKIK